MRIRAAALQLIWQLVLASAAVGVVYAARKLDLASPVIKDFKVTSQSEMPNGGLLIEGTMEKLRDCTFSEVTAYTQDGHQVHVSFLDKPPNTPATTRAVRIQAWGPWQVYSGKSTSVSLYARHSCHIFWSQTTKLTDLNLVLVTEPLANMLKEQQ